MRQPVRELDVGDGGLDVGQLDTRVGDGPVGPLVLMQQRDRPDQRQVFHVVTPGPGAAIRERQPRRERVHHRQRLEEPLRVLMRLHDPCLLGGGEEAVEGLRGTLPLVDRAGLAPVLVDRQDDAAVQELLVDVDRGGGQEDRRRPRDPVGVGHQPTRGHVLARRGDGQLAFGLQELECVGGRCAPSSSTTARTLCARSVSPM